MFATNATMNYCQYMSLPWLHTDHGEATELTATPRGSFAADIEADYAIFVDDREVAIGISRIALGAATERITTPASLSFAGEGAGYVLVRKDEYTSLLFVEDGKDLEVARLVVPGDLPEYTIGDIKKARFLAALIDRGHHDTPTVAMPPRIGIDVRAFREENETTSTVNDAGGWIVNKKVTVEYHPQPQELVGIQKELRAIIRQLDPRSPLDVLAEQYPHVNFREAEDLPRTHQAALRFGGYQSVLPQLASALYRLSLTADGRRIRGVCVNYSGDPVSQVVVSATSVARNIQLANI